MIVYHGSNSNFSVLRISPRLTKSSSSYLSEGYGIYFSLNADIAKGYGKYLYILEVNDRYVIDFRKKSECRKLLSSLMEILRLENNLDFRKYISSNKFDILLNSLANGKIGISYLDKELTNLLESSEAFYRDHSDSAREIIYRKLRVSLKAKLRVYLFNNEIPNIGVIKDVGSDVVRIVGKEKRV